MASKKQPPKPRSAPAKALEDNLYRQRIVPNKKIKEYQYDLEDYLTEMDDEEEEEYEQ